MNFNRISRSFLCLLVVCILVFNVYAIPAKAAAVSAPPIPIPVDAQNLIIAILTWLGITLEPATDNANFVTQSLIAALGWDTISDLFVYAFSAQSGITYAPRSLIEDVRSTLFDSKIVVEQLDRSCYLYAGDTFPSSNYGTCTVTTDCYAFGYKYNNLSPKLILLPLNYTSNPGSFLLSEDGTSLSCSSKYGTSGRIYFYEVVIQANLFSSLGLNTVQNGSNVYDACFSFFAGDYVNAPSTVVTSAYAAALNNFASISIPLEDAYPVPVGGAISVPDEDDETKVIVYVPIGIGETKEETESMTQEETWTGEGTISKNQSIVVPGTQTGSISQTWLGEKLDALTSVLFDVWTSIKSLADSLVDTISTALTNAFVISDTFVSSKVAALTADYPYLDTFVGLGNNLKGFFLSLGTKPPVIYIDLGAIDGQNNYGGKQIFVDLTWYAEYKPTMDAILSGFIWLWFAWRLYLNVPSLIEGGAGFWGTPDNNIGKDIIYEPQRRLESPLRYGSPIGLERQLSSGRRGLADADRRKNK